MKKSMVIKALSLVVAVCLVVGGAIFLMKNSGFPGLAQADEPPSEERQITNDLIEELLESDTLHDHMYASDVDSYNRWLHDDPKVMAVLEREDGPVALVEYYKQNKNIMDDMDVFTLQSLFNSETFKEAVGQEEYDRLFPE